MAHNPIKRQHAVSRFSDLSIHVNEVGVLYRNHQFTRLILPGGNLTWNELLSLDSFVLYVIDGAPHPLTWQVSLPAQGSRSEFTLTINLNYRVADPRRMVEDQVKDTENRITRILEPRLSKVSRGYRPSQYVEVDRAVEDDIRGADFVELCGLELLDQPDARIALTPEIEERIKKDKELERAMRVVTTAEHIADVPSQDQPDKFQVTVQLSYRVSSRDELPSDSPEEAEMKLWPRLRTVLRRVGRDYGLLDIAKADVAMQNILNNMLDKEGIEGFGLKVERVEVTTDLDDIARQRFAELANAKHTAVLVKMGRDFYLDEVIRQGDAAALAVAVSKGEITVDELYRRMSKQTELTETQKDLFNDLRQANLLDEKRLYELSKVLIDVIAVKVSGTKIPVLPTADPTPRLSDTTGPTTNAKSETS